MGDAPKLTPEQLEFIFSEFRPGLWLIIDVMADGPHVIGTSEDVLQAFAFAKVRGGVVVQVPFKLPPGAEKVAA